MVMRGATLAEVKEILGHADIKTTMRYAHLSPAHLRTAADRLDGLAPWAHRWAQSAKMDGDCAVSGDAPVAQVDRAAVS